MAFEYQHSRRVEFCDTDMAGIMHFSNFFRYMEATETAFMRSLGLSVVLTKCGLDVCLPRVHAECDYQVPLRFEDEVLVQLLVEKKTTRTLTYQFRFFKLSAEGRVEVAHGRLVAVCAARQPDGAMKAVPLPAEFSDKLQEAPADLLVSEGGRAQEAEPARAVAGARSGGGPGDGERAVGRQIHRKHL
jgi:YbgC/YbaW family acyl-CoA thioester hydrolase